MKKLLIGLVLVILSSTKIYSQVTLTDSVAKKIIKELIIKDNQSIIINLQDSTLKVYAHKDSLQQKEISNYKLTVKQYKTLVTSLEEINKLSQEQIKYIKKQKKREKIHSFLTGLGVGILVVLIL